MARLTAKAIENLKPAAERREIPDSGCRGLYAVVQPTGRKTWAVRYRFGGKTRKLTLDPTFTLAAAREAATAALREVEQGHDPAALKFAAQATAVDRAKDTVDRLAAQFIEEHAKRKTRQNSWRQTVHVFDDIVLSAWSGRVVHEIQRRDIRELVKHVATSRPVMANRTLAALSKFFAWLCEEDIILASPCVGVKPPANEEPRERALDDGEVRRLWLACEVIGAPAGAYIKLLLLTGARVSEIAEAKWSEVRGDVLEFPIRRMKAKRPHIVPLSTQAAAIIESLPRIGDYVFGRSPVSHLNRIKQELGELMGDMEPWQLRDVRRTVRTGMGRLGIDDSIAERVIAHSVGGVIMKTYNTYNYLPEMRAALQKWADHVDMLVSGRKAGKVVQLRG